MNNGTYLLACATTRPSVARPGEASVNEQSNRQNTDLSIALAVNNEVRDVQKALLLSLKICNSDETITIAGLHRESEGMKSLMKLIRRHPPISAGVLLWVRDVYQDSRFQRSSAFTTGVKTLLYLVSLCSRSHPLQKAQAFFILTQIFPMKPETVSPTKVLELKKNMINEMIIQMQLGYVLPVIDFMKQNSIAAAMDHSLLRHFVTQVLQSVLPPFSQDFINGINGLLQTPSCTRALRAGQSPVIQRLIQNFRVACVDQQKKKKLEKVPKSDAESLAQGVRSSTDVSSQENSRNGGDPNATGSNRKETIRLVPFTQANKANN